MVVLIKKSRLEVQDRTETKILQDLNHVLLCQSPAFCMSSTHPDPDADPDADPDLLHVCSTKIYVNVCK